MKAALIEKNLVNFYLDSVRDKGPGLYLRGRIGRGKTSLIMKTPQLLQAANPGKTFGIAVINGPCLSISTASGYLWPTEQDGAQYSRFTRPDWWITTEGKPLEEYDGGIVFVDEMDKCDPDVKKILGEAMLSKRFASHILPPGWVMWGAGNTKLDRSGSTKEFDHLIGRRREIEFDDDLESLAHWMEDNGCLPETIVFVNEHPDTVFPSEPPKEQGPSCNPRSLVEGADRFLQMLMGDSHVVPTGAEVMEMVAGSIGQAAAVQYFATVRLGQELPDYEEIIAKPKETRVPTKPDAVMIACHKIGRRVTKEDLAPAVQYISRLPEEFAVMFCRTIVKRDRTLVTHSAMKDWIAKNASLVALTAKLN
jgi:hypothetical protein